jgi:hypothetical protein
MNKCNGVQICEKASRTFCKIKEHIHYDGKLFMKRSREILCKFY